MTTLTLDLFLDGPPVAGTGCAHGSEERGAAGGDPRPDAPAAAEGRGRRTLDELIVGVWEDLSAHHAVACPVCGEQMRPRYGAGSAPVGGRCTGCASSLG
jgi:hypothetical protein